MGTVSIAPCISTVRQGTVKSTFMSARFDMAFIKVDIMMFPTSTSGAVNAFPCQVVRVTEDVSSVFAALRPEAASPGAPPLWMELAKDAWAALPDRERLWAAVRPEDLMLLK